MTDWNSDMSTAPKSTMLNLFCPGACPPTLGVLQGIWSDRLNNWILNPYGTTGFTTLFPTAWALVEAPPT